MKDKEYIERILKYAKNIQRSMSTVDNFEDFNNNEDKIGNIILNLEQIGETAKKISNEIKNKYKEVFWKGYIGIRNIISHQYEGIDLTSIYQDAKYEIPKLIEVLSKS